MDGYIKVKTNDWDIPFSKIYLEFIKELGKNIFSIRENGINPLEILPILRNIWLKGPENICIFNLCI